ncbi:unnamed protein product [Ranitomeya imitator]|uniref:5-hydroxytryptamine receptor 3A n=1 Tax=Ranitomeya imitator TaxID=111125 RepID=A0ABN9LF09_9NEOB|nr:unnamed protein product [Ranitomeya imitator]
MRRTMGAADAFLRRIRCPIVSLSFIKPALHDLNALYLDSNPISAVSYELESNRSTLVELSDHLMDGYHKDVRPVKNWRTTTTVYIEVAVYAILGVDEKNQFVKTYIWYNQSWVDEFLKWDPIQFDNITHIFIPTHSIWLPDIMIEEVVGARETTNAPYIYVNNRGRVFKKNPIHIMTSCNLDIYHFPFDFLNCSISFRSWLHSTQEINISLWRTPKDMQLLKDPSEDDGEWDLVSVVPSYEVTTDHNNNYGQITFYWDTRRRKKVSNDLLRRGCQEKTSLLHIVNLILPSVLLMIMDIIGFYIPPESGERISFKITLLLGYSVFLIIVSDTLPATGAPLIGIYFALCMILLLISLTESILIVRSFHQQNLRPEVPKWLKTLVLEKMTVFISIKDRGESDGSNSGACFHNENVSSGINDGVHLAFLYVNPISFRLFLTVRSQTLTPVSTHSLLIWFLVHFLLWRHIALSFRS